MKKFLSLVLALVMTISLATISAGATEYKDLTDKDEIQYEEAVAVLNRIGIITGYEDGSFQPENELTRGAAAKIIVSLLIGPDAASNLGNGTSPYPDVPANYTFAGVISYCKTAGIISGYSDGTFKPGNSLTGYAFAKMLLGALGYRSDLEGLTGTGWTMNVARLGNAAGLFNRLNFDGSESVNREQACQLALNTLKATMVEYTGGLTITAGDATVVGGMTRTYVTSNQDYAGHINNKKVTISGNAKDDHYTVEFGEEHFKDLRMVREATSADAFGRPSNEWSYKKVTIGTFPVEADFIYDSLMSYADKTDAVKNRATGLSGYTLKDDNGSSNVYTNFWVNGQKFELDSDGKWKSSRPETNNPDAIKAGNEAKIANIADLTDNGTVVEVYVSEDTADFITDVVVVKTQLMEIKKVGSDYVSLQMYDNSTSDDADKSFYGFNQKAINEKVTNVQAEDDAYSALKDLKVGDIVAVIPVDDSDGAGTDWKVAEAYQPETVSGALTAVEDYGPTDSTKNAVNLTVGGTKYNIALWNKDMADIDGEKIKVTRKDVTLYLDKHGNALLAEDVGATNDFMIVGAFRSGLENGRIVTTVTGWDISGNEVELNLGPNYNRNNGIVPGDLVKYSSNSKSNITDWTISEADVYNVYTGEDDQTNDAYEIKASNVKIKLRDYGDDTALYIDKSVKFIYVTFDVDGEVESIEVKNGVQNVENKELLTTGANYNGSLGINGGVIDYAASGNVAKAIDNYNSAQACVKSDAVKAVIIKQESNDAVSSSMLYIRDMPGGAQYDSNNKMVYKYTVAMNGPDGLVDDEMTIYSYDRLYRGDFASYAKTENSEFSPFYNLRQHNDFVGRTTSTFRATVKDIVDVNKGLVELEAYKAIGGSALDTDPNVKTSHKSTLGLGDEANIAAIKKAVFVDLSGNDIDSYDDLKTFMYTYASGANKGETAVVRQSKVTAELVINDNTDNDGFRTVAMVVVVAVDEVPDNTKLTQASLLTANIKGVKFGGSDTAITSSNTVSGLTEKVAASNAQISFTHNGNDIEISVAGKTWSSTMPLTQGDVITVKVTALDGTTSNTYTFTVSALEALKYQNGTAKSYASATGYTATEWDNTVASSVQLSGTSFQFPYLNTGVKNETEAQLKEAIQYYNDKNSGETQLGAPTYVANGIWGIPCGSITLTFDESNAAKVLVKINDGNGNITNNIVAKNAQLSASLSMQGIVKETKVDNTTVVWHEVLTDTVNPGSTYQSEAGAKLTAGSYTSSKFSLTYEDAQGNALTAGTSILEKDDVVTVKLTVTGSDIDLSPSGTALKITLSDDADANLVCSDAANLDSTAPATKTVITFTKGMAGAKLAVGATITFTLTVDSSDVGNASKKVTVPNITVQDPA